MSIKGLSFAGVAIVMLAGCDRVPGTPQSAARSALAQSMFDPGAMKLKILSGGVPSQAAVCGLVNGKNRMGAYVGFKPFIYEAGSVSVFDGVPKLSDIRSWRHEGNEDQLETIARVDAACKFPDAWQAKCLGGDADSIPRNEQLCSLWKAHKYGALFDLADAER